MRKRQAIDLIEEAEYYWQSSDKMKYNTAKLDISTDSNRRTFNKILCNLVNSRIKCPRPSRFLSNKPDSNFRMVKDVYHELFNGKYDSVISDFETKIHLDHNLDVFDSKIFSEMDFDNRSSKVVDIRIYSLTNIYSSVLLSHEEMHGLVEQLPSPMGYNCNYDEVLPILLEKIVADKLDKKYGDNTLLKSDKVRFDHTRSCAYDYCFIDELLHVNDSDLKKKFLISNVKEYNTNINYMYLIGTIYAERLFEYYQDNPVELMARVDNIIQRRESMFYVLNDLKVGLSNTGTINAFNKTLKKVSK